MYAITGDLPGGHAAAPRDGAAVWRLRATLRRAARRVRRLLPSLTSVWSRLPLERLFWIGFTILLLAFVVLLVVQPTGAGRGGR